MTWRASNEFLERVRRQAIRANDAAQLGTAVVAREANPDIAFFARYDDELTYAEVREGFADVP